jgi:hypothetical protein
MVKRSVATFGWFLSTWCLYELIVYFAGAPRVLGPVLGVLAAAVVGLDPFDVIWRSARDASAPVPADVSSLALPIEPGPVVAAGQKAA